MEAHLRRVANSKDNPAEFASRLETQEWIDDLSGMLESIICHRRAKREASLWIDYYLGQMEAGLRDPGKFIDDPMFIERLVHFLRTVANLVPKRRHWDKPREALLRLEFIAAETQVTRDRIQLAHKKEPAKMSGNTSADSLLLPD